MSAISQLYRQKPCVFSIECFPPKQTTKFAAMQDTLRRMKALDPDFISVTYGAGGSAGGVSSVQVASFLKNELGIQPLAHVLCMGSDRQKAAAQLEALRAAGVRDVLALRGDRTPLRPESPDFHHACDLMDFIRDTAPDISFAGACYPEGHPEAESLAADVANLRHKQQAGASHLVSQLFFDNGKYYRFLNMARKAGVTLPISAGVMPIVRRSQIERTVALSSASLPSAFTRMISRWQDDPQSLYQAGIEYAVEQLRDLIEGGADGVHLYAMNDAGVAAAVYDGIRDLL
ncbi:MAG TPA: methylenetetrahydrofolate reductase [Candidatus Gemmiger stercorigallinarum]|nr:methylenetetrahydrofolate reductase [Candidatus Gemmiger stercorigallinarum]